MWTRHVSYEHDTAYCIWSDSQSESPISISLVSFQRNVVKETWRTRLLIEICEWRNDTPDALGCTSQRGLSLINETSQRGLSHIKEVCHMSTRRVTYKCVMLHMDHMNKTRLTWTQHASYAHNTPLMNTTRLLWTQHVSYEHNTPLMNTTRLLWTKHVSYEQNTSLMNKTGLLWTQYVWYEHNTSLMNTTGHIWPKHVWYEQNTSDMNTIRHMSHMGWLRLVGSLKL